MDEDVNAVNEPLTPPDCDLRAYPTMPLNVGRLRDSGLSSHENAEVFRAAVMLWCAAWHQVPAASLPNDDRELANLAGFGRFVKEWMKIKDEALHGFTLCSDGRLYHHVVAEVALPAWETRKKYLERSRKANEARHGQKGKAEGGDDDPSGVATRLPSRRPTRPPSSVLASRENGTERNGEEESLPSVVAKSGKPDVATPPAKAPVPAKPKKAAAKGTTLPVGWFVDDDGREYARGKGFTDDEIDDMEEGFRLWWPAQPGVKGRKTDWSLTWMTWVRNEKDRRQHGKSGTRSRGRPGQSFDRLQAFHTAGMGGPDQGRRGHGGGGQGDHE